MIDKFKSLLQSALAKIPTISPRSLPMKVVVGIALAWVFLFFLFVAAFCYNWYVSNKADLSALTSFLQTNLGTAAIAAGTFLCKAFVDTDNDGIPDEFEEKKGD